MRPEFAGFTLAGRLGFGAVVGQEMQDEREYCRVMEVVTCLIEKAMMKSDARI